MRRALLYQITHPDRLETRIGSSFSNWRLMFDSTPSTKGINAWSLVFFHAVFSSSPQLRVVCSSTTNSREWFLSMVANAAVSSTCAKSLPGQECGPCPNGKRSGALPSLLSAAAVTSPLSASAKGQNPGLVSRAARHDVRQRRPVCSRCLGSGRRQQNRGGRVFLRESHESRPWNRQH